MAKPYQLLRVTRIVLLVLAYVSGVANLIFAGFLPLVMGGEPVPLFLDGPAISVRVLGILNILITAPLLFVVFYVPSGIIHLLLELRDAVRRLAGAARAAAELNLAAVQLRLASPDEARQTLEQMSASPPGSSWSATAAYLRGLAYEGLGRSADARAAFERASTAHATTMGDGGPSIATLAQRKLKGPSP